MADQQVVFEMNSNDASTVRAWMNFKNSIAAVEGALGKIDDKQDANTKSAQRYDKAAAGIFASTRTPLERYEAQTG